MVAPCPLMHSALPPDPSRAARGNDVVFVRPRKVGAVTGVVGNVSGPPLPEKGDRPVIALISGPIWQRPQGL